VRLNQSRIRRVLLAAGLPVIAAAPARAQEPSRTLAPISRITALPLDAPPVNGFVPRVVFGLTTEQDPNDFTFEAHPSSTPGPTKFPTFGSPQYFVATFDTGAQSHILSDAAATALHLAGPPSREGAYEAELVGASGSEFASISDGLGIYMTGLGNASGGASISVTPGTMKGQTNTAILSAEEDSILPNIIGVPMIAQYQTVIRTSVPREITHGATTYHSPDVSFQALNTPYPSNYSRLTFDVMSPTGVAPNPVFIPSLDNFNNNADNPTTSTFWMTLFANTNVADSGGEADARQFLFDTGAQVTVLSQDTAAEVGFFSAGENPSTPEFFVEVQGVGGTQQVPGFYLETLNVMTNGGPMEWTHVPVLVLDVIDPRDGVGFVPGILGMNLFTDRDLIINGGLTNPSVAISPQHQWSTNSSGNWGDLAKWQGGMPDSIDRVANFLGKITSPQTVTVNGDYTVGSINFKNANRYTLNGPGRITLQSSEGAAGITVAQGSHTINAPMTLASDTAIWVLPAASKLTMTNDITATGRTITKGGDGTVEMKNVRAAALEVNEGTVAILPAGNAGGVSVVSDLTVADDARLDLQNNNLIVKGGDIGSWDGSGYTGVTGLIVSGKGDGSWNGGGIVTSQSSATSSLLTTLAVATADDIGAGATWSGQSVVGDDVLVMYTWGGDADLNGELNGDDYFFIDSNVINSGSVFGFTKGDFDLNGEINGDDYFIIDSNITFAQSNPPFFSGSGAGGLTTVPEPAACGFALLAGVALPLRRRRK
jgi:hypothetical protein